MDPTPLPGGAGQDLGHRVLETEVRVGGHEPDAVQAAADQLPREVEPELVILGGPDVGAEDFTRPTAAHPTAIATAIETTRPFSRTFSKVASNIR